MDVIHWLSRAGVEAIGQAGFGRSFGTIDSKDAALHPIVVAVKNFLSVFRSLVHMRVITPLPMEQRACRKASPFLDGRFCLHDHRLPDYYTSTQSGQPFDPDVAQPRPMRHAEHR